MHRLLSLTSRLELKHEGRYCAPQTARFRGEVATPELVRCQLPYTIIHEYGTSMVHPSVPKGDNIHQLPSTGIPDSHMPLHYLESHYYLERVLSTAYRRKLDFLSEETWGFGFSCVVNFLPMNMVHFQMFPKGDNYPSTASDGDSESASPVL